jgi:hypothetical protein
VKNSRTPEDLQATLGAAEAMGPGVGGVPIDLELLDYPGMVASGRSLRALSSGAVTRQDVAARVVEYFYDGFRVPATGERAFVLARCFQTCAYARMPLSYRDAADRLLAETVSQPDMRCLTLLATRGHKSLWNDPATSSDHMAIPLPSVEVVRRAPMIARMLEQLGMPVEDFVATTATPELLMQKQRNFNVFHIARAAGSPFVPVQEEFVKAYGVRSVVGLGGVFPTGEFFAVLLFARVAVSHEVAMLFRTLALSVKLALLPFAADGVFSRPAV